MSFRFGAYGTPIFVQHFGAAFFVTCADHQGSETHFVISEP